MFTKDMRLLYDIAQSPRPSSNLVYSRLVTFMFKVTFMLVLFQGKDNSHTMKKKNILNDFIWRSKKEQSILGQYASFSVGKYKTCSIYSVTG